MPCLSNENQRMKSRGVFCYVLCAASILCASVAGHAQEIDRETAVEALRKAVEFFDGQVSAEGGYLWQYTADLARREGEGKADASTGWVQPPGTPSVGLGLLQAYARTGERACLEAAKHSAHALVKTQLVSGGWDYRMIFAPDERVKYAYRVNDTKGERNTTTLDDNTTQAALRFLMRMDKTLEFQDEGIHEAVVYALDKLMAAQYPNGAWPQRFETPPDPAAFPVKPAAYPSEWPREHPNIDYKTYYTFNDGTIADMIDIMLDAWDIYGNARYREAAEKGGGFIILAQMPEPQPAWAQQYNADMEPAWARRFEPPAVTGGESQGVLRTLLMLYDRTGEKRFLEPVPKAIAYLRASRLDDGRLARFYELQTNTPLYFTPDYVLTYDDSDMPTHYSFKSGDGLDDIEARYERLAGKGPELPKAAIEALDAEPSEDFVAQAAQIIDAQDERGAWVQAGKLRYHGEDDPAREIITSATFVKNIGILGRYIQATQQEGSPDARKEEARKEG